VPVACMDQTGCRSRAARTAWLHVICDGVPTATCGWATPTSSGTTASVPIGVGWRIRLVCCRRFRDGRNEPIVPDRKRTTEQALRIPRHLQGRTDRGRSPARLGTAKYNPVGLKDSRGALIHSLNMQLPSLHPGRSEFSPIRRDGGLYVDKTGHLRKLLVPAGGDGSHLHTQYAFLARPRRFGQTLLVSTLEAYFQGDLPKSGPGDSGAFYPNAGQRVDLFRGTAIEDDVRRTRVHPVVRLNMAMATSDTPAGLQAKLLEHLERLYTDWHRRGVETDMEPRRAGGYIRFPPPPPGSEAVSAASRLDSLLHELERQFNASPVVLIDEYDAPLTHLLGRNLDPEPFISVLREFFGRLKHNEDRLHFVFITGISRFAHVNLFSALNNLTDISWDPEYSDLCGFTEADMQDYLLPYLEAGAGHLGKPVEQVTQELIVQRSFER